MAQAVTHSQGAGFEARCLLRRACWATLATQSEGQPHTALVTHAVTPDGTVLMLLSAMAEHTQQLAAEPRCALMVTGAPENANWQTAPRLTLTGRAERSEDPWLRRQWVTQHPYASLYADFSDFSVWRVVADAGLFVAGFGRIHRLAASDLSCPPSAVAALAAAQSDIVADTNGSHSNDVTRLAHAAGHTGRWVLLGLDPDGLTLGQDELVSRIAFPAPVNDAAEARAALANLLRS